MEPPIQYAQTTDGASIAFWTLGEGMPFVVLPPFPVSHIQLEWRIPEYRRMYERMAKNRKLVRYDSRGFGLSQRDVTDFSLAAYLLDLEAVVDRLGLERLALFAVYNSGPVGIAYTAHHPKRVSHLILWCARPRLITEPSPGPSEAARWERLFVEANWELYTETMVHQVVGWSESELAHRMAELMRESVTREHMEAFMAAYPGLDATPFLPEVRSPTLVVYRRQVPSPGVDVARDLASRIPDARLVALEGASIAPFAGDTEAVLRAIDEFLGLKVEEAAEPVPAAPGVVCGLVTILFTDVEGSTALTQRLGDARAREVLRAHERIVREALRAHGGAEVKTLGDGFMASFPSATGALECAIAMQRAFAAHNETAEEPIRVRIGLSAGEPIADEEDLFGMVVIMAARIAARAQGAEILAANVVRELAAGKRFLFTDRGETTLQGFEEPVRLYQVRWEQ